MKWAFIGSSPIAPRHVAEILPALRPCRTIACNAAIKLLHPDVYFVADRVACRRYAPLAQEAREQSGTRLVTMHRFNRALEERNVHWFDEFVINGVDPPTPERWGCFNMSGPFAMEYACRQGATELHLLGCEGYSSRSYFDQHERGEEHTEPALRHKIADGDTLKQLIKRLTLVVQCFRHVPFYVYGEACYSIDSPNWKRPCV